MASKTISDFGQWESLIAEWIAGVGDENHARDFTALETVLEIPRVIIADFHARGLSKMTLRYNVLLAEKSLIQPIAYPCEVISDFSDPGNPVIFIKYANS